MSRKSQALYICSDVDLPLHPRIVACEDPGGCLGLWQAMTAYSRQHLTDGIVPRRYVVGLWGDVARNTQRVEDMLKTELIAAVGENLVVLRYAPRNQTKDMVEDSRKKARERMAKGRAGKGKTVRANKGRTNAEHAVHVPASASPSRSQEERASQEEIPAPEPTGARRRAERATDDGAMGLAVSAWLDGVREVTKQPCSVGPGPTRALVDALVEHCPELGERVPFARAKAVEWAKHCIGSGKLLNPHGFVDWLNTPKTPSGIVRAAPRANGVAPGKQPPSEYGDVPPEQIPDQPMTAKGR